jgi:hypothetical protein
LYFGKKLYNTADVLKEGGADAWESMYLKTAHGGWRLAVQWVAVAYASLAWQQEMAWKTDEKDIVVC